MAEVEEQYAEEAEGEYYEEEGMAGAEDDKDENPHAWYSMYHYAHMNPVQYYAGFGAPFAMMFAYMLIQLIFFGKWQVAAPPLVIAYEYKNPRTIPFTVCFILQLCCAVGGWVGAFMGVALNYLEMPPGNTFVFFANMVNLFAVLLFIFCGASIGLITMSREVIRNAFTMYNWNNWKTREELCRLPNGEMCSRSGPPENVEAQRLVCAKRMYSYKKTITFTLAILGMIFALLCIFFIYRPAAGGAIHRDGDKDEAEEEEGEGEVEYAEGEEAGEGEVAQ